VSGAPDPASSLPVFLAYSVELEAESAERLRELADVLRAHHDEPAADVLETLAVHSDRHCASVRELCGDQALPELAPWDFAWPGGTAPETAPYDAIGYEETPRRLLSRMVALELAARDWYAGVAERSGEPRVRELAQQFADEEAEHAQALERLLGRLPDSADRPRIDPDPPLEIE
jgi:rubrerythrin